MKHRYRTVIICAILCTLTACASQKSLTRTTTAMLYSSDAVPKMRIQGAYKFQVSDSFPRQVKQ